MRLSIDSPSSPASKTSKHLPVSVVTVKDIAPELHGIGVFHLPMTSSFRCRRRPNLLERRHLCMFRIILGAAIAALLVSILRPSPLARGDLVSSALVVIRSIEACSYQSAVKLSNLTFSVASFIFRKLTVRENKDGTPVVDTTEKVSKSKMLYIASCYFYIWTI